MEEENYPGGIVPLTHDGMSNVKGRKVPDHIPELPERASTSTAPAVGYEAVTNTGDAKPPQTVVQGTGRRLTAPPVNPRALELAARSICNGPYLEAAYRYRNNFGVVSVGSVIDTNTPAAPTLFTQASIPAFLKSLFDSKTIAPPHDPPTTGDARPTPFYIVMLPSTISFIPGSVNGFHSFFDWTSPTGGASKRIYYAWVLNTGSLDKMTSVFSHELVEAYTDPEGTYVQLVPASSSSWNEVGDVCSSSAFLDGVLVQSYWSRDQNACVIPYYSLGDVRDNVPTGIDFQVIAIRRAWSRERRSFFILELKVKDPSTGDTFQIFESDAITRIEDNSNTFFIIGSDGVRANVVTVQVHAHFVLSTMPDVSTADNLLSLPTF